MNKQVRLVAAFRLVSAISGNFESKTTKKRAPTGGSKGFVLS